MQSASEWQKIISQSRPATIQVAPPDFCQLQPPRSQRDFLNKWKFSNQKGKFNRIQGTGLFELGSGTGQYRTLSEIMKIKKFIFPWKFKKEFHKMKKSAIWPRISSKSSNKFTKFVWHFIIFFQILSRWFSKIRSSLNFPNFPYISVSILEYSFPSLTSLCHRIHVAYKWDLQVSNFANYCD